MPLTLGPALQGTPRPSFQASLDGRSAIVELDSAAVLKLAAQASGAQLDQLLDGKRDAIGKAAARIAEDGFATERGDTLEILVTALDL